MNIRRKTRILTKLAAQISPPSALDVARPIQRGITPGMAAQMEALQAAQTGIPVKKRGKIRGLYQSPYPEALRKARKKQFYKDTGGFFKNIFRAKADAAAHSAGI